MENVTQENLFLCTKRRRQSTLVKEDAGALANAENDRARIVFSPPFRRLQDRAQVFALEENVSVRNRLTHSLEVSHIGRILATIACKSLHKKNSSYLSDGEDIAAIAQTVDSACLVHDIGNPPFGHFGEHAIKHWFQVNQDFFCAVFSSKVEATEFRRRYKDFTKFDGNAQGFRILTTLQRNHDEFSLNLTMMLLASSVKYPGTADNVGDISAGKLKKAGIYFTEQAIFEQVWECCGLQTSPAQRHPLSYLMEAADDIAYCMSDMEDAVIKGIYDAEFVMDYLGKERGGYELIDQALQKADAVPKETNKIKSYGLAPFMVFRAALILEMIHYAAEVFACRVNQGTLIGSPPLIEDNSPVHETLKRLKDFAKKHIYNSRVVHDRELTGAVVITGILEAFKPLLSDTRRNFLSVIKEEKADDAHPVGPALCSLLPTKGKAIYRHFVESQAGSLSDVNEWMLRAHLIVDFVSGMTDHYALSIYRKISSP